MKHKESTAKLISCEIIDNLTITKIEFHKLLYPPLTPSWFGYVKEVCSPHLRLDKVIQRDGNVITFKTFDNKPCLLQTGQKYTFRQLWNQFQLEIAQSNPEKWSKEIFKAADMQVFKRPDGTSIGRQMYDSEDIGSGVIIPNGWGHEHCELCFKTIAANDSYEHAGYTNGSNWVCIECYGKYISSGFGKKLGDLD